MNTIIDVFSSKFKKSESDKSISKGLDLTCLQNKICTIESWVSAYGLLVIAYNLFAYGYQQQKSLT